jgi:hypothetical protein
MIYVTFTTLSIVHVIFPMHIEKFEKTAITGLELMTS